MAVCSFACFAVFARCFGIRGDRIGGRLVGGAVACLMFVMAGEAALLLVTQTGRRFLHGGAIADQLMGGALALFVQPDAGVFAHVPEKMPVQGAHGDAALFGQGRGRPLGLPRQ